MLPPVFTTLQASAAVRALLGARPRVHRHGEAPQGETKPYAVWLVVSGVPENTLSESPSMDRNSIQIDIYSKIDAECVEIAEAVRDQMETVTHMTAWRVLPREADTGLYRVSMDFDWFLSR
jgi:hypothetical protein